MRSSGHAPHRARLAGWLRVVAGFMALQLLALTIGPSLHFGRVEHVLCLEHGQLEHAHRPSPHQGATPRPQSGDRSAVVAGDLERGEHVACAETLATHAPAIDQQAPPGVEAPALPAGVTVTTAPRVAISSVELLAQAPKLSPPRA